MAERSSAQHDELSGVRDTVESVYVAVVVALVLRAFLVEAFVIPTGSMAPRLFGEHWDLRCPSCGYEYAFGRAKKTPNEPEQLDRGEKYSVGGARCPNCGYAYEEAQTKELINSGDRVLVLKYLYRFREPEPWEVVVFRNPQDDRQNYIKRLIGLPGEKIEIVHGDVFFCRKNDDGTYGPWQIRRKGPDAQAAMWQIVFDNDYRPDPNLPDSPQCPQWTDPQGRWKLGEIGGRRFSFPGSPRPAELRFDARPDAFLPRYGYNGMGSENYDSALDVCSDLRLEATFLPEALDSQIALETTGLEQAFRAEVQGDGTVTLLHRPVDDAGAAWQPWGTAKKVEGLSVGRGCEIALAHADFRVQVWVEGRVVLQSTDQQYPADHEAVKARMTEVSPRRVPTQQVAIFAQGGPCHLEHVRLLRDVYYTCPSLSHSSDGPLGDYFREARGADALPGGGRGWGTTDNPIELRRNPANPDLDEFFVLGDNSPQSLDGRMWVDAAPTLRLYDENRHRLYKLGTVPRYTMIGRAFLVYWPSGFRIPGLPSLPLIPNVGRMRMIR